MRVPSFQSFAAQVRQPLLVQGEGNRILWLFCGLLWVNLLGIAPTKLLAVPELVQALISPSSVIVH